MDSNDTPKLCECGCGQSVPIGKRFINHHWARIQPRLEWSDDLWTVINLGYSTECYIWKRGRTAMGYGIFQRRYAHVIAYELQYGPIPEGLELDHLCRQTLCIRPEHLEAVTHQENMRRAPMTKLPQEQVKLVREAAGSHTEIGYRFGISASHVSRIKKGYREH